MDSSLYKEISYKIQGFRVVSWLIAAVSLLLCILIGAACYTFVVGMHGTEAFKEVPVRNERITIIEGKVEEPLAQKSLQEIGSEDEFLSTSEEDVQPVAHLQFANKFLRKFPSEENEDVGTKKDSVIHPHNYKTSFSMRYPMLTESEVQMPKEENDEYLEKTLKMLGDFAAQFARETEEEEEEESGHQRVKRNVFAYNILSYIPYLTYPSLGEFVYRQVSEIAEHNIEMKTFQSRKLGGDPEVNFLDGLWPLPAQKPNKKTVKKSSAKLPNEETQNTQDNSPAAPNRNRWQPLVNQVPLTFVAEILRTLLNLMKEFLMKDHVMECLWYMFCQDVNHQAKYSDIYGILARVNSVGLKVLTESDQQLRESDTFGEVWRSVTAWTPLQCDVMFPRCDGPKALEIVNEVAMGSN